ncbi:MAG TPA: DegT/DnrJ/EryC1/StrS family aminotransferase [Dehalococcoidia bacterium]|nr:DegT/DnrJ/EryC1/StrS family aminotransferase [Dehalococcoidia bacterium]
MKVPPAAVYFPEEDRAQIAADIAECLASGALTLGRHDKQFEEEFARLCGVPYAVAVNSGTSALEIILRSIGVEGREVIVPSNTFFATPAAVLHAGGRVRFADCEPESFALDIASLRANLNANTAAVIVVHIGGIITPHLPEIAETCARVGVPLIEDAAHAHGSTLNGKAAGSFGLAAAFSFYPTKVITSGEGGMITTGDEALHREALIYRDQGKEGFTTNFHVRLGYNWRMSEPHAVIGLAQLRRLPEFIARRQEIAAVYDEDLGRLGEWLRPVRPTRNGVSNYYKYMAMLDPAVDRAALKKKLREEFDVGLSGEVYETPCHQQPVFADCAGGTLTRSEEICARHICLPVSAKMTKDDALYVVSSLEAALSEATVAAARAGN